MAKQDEQDVSIDGKDESDDPLISRDQPLEKLRGSVYEYDQPCDPVGTEDWAVLEVSDEPRTLAVWRAAGELFEGDRAAADRWMHKEVRGLGWRRPVDVMQENPQRVLDLIGRIEHGISS